MLLFLLNIKEADLVVLQVFLLYLQPVAAEVLAEFAVQQDLVVLVVLVVEVEKEILLHLHLADQVIHHR